MKKSVLLICAIWASLSLFAETKIKGAVKVYGTEQPATGAVISLKGQKATAKTNALGEFELKVAKPGNKVLSVSLTGYEDAVTTVTVKDDETNNLGVVYVRENTLEATQDEIMASIAELTNDMESDDDFLGAGQMISGLLSSNRDVYSRTTSYNFSPMRFNLRGYSQDHQSTYINGVNFNGSERGNFNYSMLGGLNDASRNREVSNGMESNNYSYGNLGSSTNINMKASNYAAGGRASIALTNGAYMLRGAATYSTGLMPNGWAITGSVVARWAKEGIVEGTSYSSAGYFLSVEKMINKQHSLSLVTWGAPTERSQTSAVTSEVTELTGSIYYNPYWGWQDGKKRNSRVVKSYTPTAILSHEWKINDRSMLRTGIGFMYSMYSNSALTFYNAPDPRPDYYRYLPSYLNDGHYDAEGNLLSGLVNTNLQNQMTELWKNRDPKTTQIDWDNLYQSNYRNNVVNPTGTARYALERRHNDLMETTLNSTYSNSLTDHLKLTAGIEAKYSKGIHYKTMDDLLGGNQWIDIDQFAERDLTGGTLQDNNNNIIQNNIGGDSIITAGERFGYDYDINIIKASAFIQNEWNFNAVEFYYAAKVTYTQFNRFGHMLNGRAEAIGAISKGKGNSFMSVDPSVKAGVMYKINGRNIITANVLAETRAPLAYNAYISPRIKDTKVQNLTNEKVLSYDIAYNFSFPIVQGRIAAFQTHMLDGVKLSGFYNDEYRTFTNVSMNGIDRIYRGIEAGVSVKAGKYFTVVAAGTLADYHYTSDADGVLSPENGAFDDIQDKILIKGLKVNSGPQTAVSLGLKFFHPKMWFADVNVNYFDNNYLDFAPSRFMSKNMALYGDDTVITDDNGNVYTYPSPAKQVLGTQERLKGGFIVNASFGKMIYLPNRQSININLSVNNLLNNTSMVTGGYQQGRIPVVDGKISTNYNKFPNKYYYSNGINFFLNVGYRF